MGFHGIQQHEELILWKTKDARLIGCVRSLLALFLFSVLVDVSVGDDIEIAPGAEQSGPENEPQCDVKKLQQILSDLTATYEPWNPILVKYTVKQSRTEEYLRRNGYSSTEPIEFSVEATLARKGDCIRTSHRGPLVVDGRLKACDQPFVHVFDGTHATTYDNHAAADGKPVYCVSVDVKFAEQGYIQPLDFLSPQSLLEAIRRSIESKGAGSGAAICSLSEMLAENGTARLRLSFTHQDGTYLVSELLPNSGHALHLFEYGTKNVPMERISGITYQWVDGRPFPVHAVRTQYLRGTNEVLRQRILNVQSVVTDPRDIPDEMFHLQIPGDAYVYDEDLGRTLRDRLAIEDRLRHIAGELPERRHFGVRTVVVLVNIVLLIGLVILLLVRFWRVRER